MKTKNNKRKQQHEHENKNANQNELASFQVVSDRDHPAHKSLRAVAVARRVEELEDPAYFPLHQFHTLQKDFACANCFIKC